MASRPDITVVIRTHGLLMRSDLRASGGASGAGAGEPEVQRWRKDWADVGAAVAHALSEGGPAGRRVFVLDSDVWLGVVELPGSAVAGLADKNLADPAAFEAEAVSGLSPAEAVTAVQRRRLADQDDQFLVSQATRGDVMAVAKAVRSAGAKLAGIGHPAGLPEAFALEGRAGVADPAEAASGGGWRRVEFWADAVVLVESVGGRDGLVPLGVGSGSDWRRALDPVLRRRDPVVQDQTLVGAGVRVRGGTQWRESTAVSGDARWLAAGDDADEDDGVPVWDLFSDATADLFASAWTRQLAAVSAGGEGVTPMVRPPKAPAAKWPAVAVGVLVLALAVTAVMYQRDQAAQNVTALQAQLDHVLEDRDAVEARTQQVNRAKADARKKQQAVTRLERELTQLRQRQARRAAAGSSLVDRRQALSAMMSALTRSADEQIVLRAIEHGSPRHEITGMASTPEAASRLARGLSTELRDHWRVSPASIEPKAGPQGIVWAFSITMEPFAAVEARP